MKSVKASYIVEVFFDSITGLLISNFNSKVNGIF